MKKRTKKQARELAKELVKQSDFYVETNLTGLICINYIKKGLFLDYVNIITNIIYENKFDYETIERFLLDDFVVDETMDAKDGIELVNKFGGWKLRIWTEPFGRYYYLDELNKTWTIKEY